VECGDESPRDAWEAWTVAYVALGLGDKNRVLDALEIAYRHRHSWMPWIGVIPMFDALHAEPRFADLLRRPQPPAGPKPNARSG
jgi:hypothetical protein